MSGIAMSATVGVPLVTEWPPDAQTQRTCPPTFTVTDEGSKRSPPDPTVTSAESVVELDDTVTIPVMPEPECGMQK